MMLTGLAMYGENNPGGFTDSLFGWVVLIFGSSQMMHTMHHLIAWVFPVYLILHIYAVISAGVTSSIVTGYKNKVEECSEYAD